MAKKRHIGAILTLKDNMSATLKGVRKEQSEFRKDVKSTRKALESTFKRKRNLRINNTAAMKKIKQTRKALDPLRKKIVTAVAYKDMIKGKFNKTKNQLKSFGRRVFSPVIKAKDKTGSILNKVKNSIFSLKGLAAGLVIGGGATAAIGKTLSAGSMLEQQQISMEHFIGVNNKDKSQEEVKEMTKNFVKSLRDNANSTPFETQEVISAGSRAINIAKGDSKGAMDLVKLAENMAALNPEKSLGDAMEALADVRMGEFERMKEFGFKIGAKDVEKAGGVQSIIDKQLKPFFEGGAEKLSTSGAGLWSTIKGKLGAKIQDTGLNILEKLKPQMDGAIALIDRFSPTLDKWSQKIGDGIGFALGKFEDFSSWIGQYMPMAKDVIGDVAGWFGEKFGWLRGETSNLKGSFKGGFKIIGNVMKTAWKVGKPALDLIADGIKILYYGFKMAFPYIKSIVKTTWSIVEPILSKLGEALGWVAEKAGKIAEWFGKKNSEKSGTQIVKETRVEPYTLVNGTHAKGLDRVPFDGYIAELHKDEQIVTASENPHVNQSRSSKTKGIIIEKLMDKFADTVVIREEADIDKIATAFVRKIEEASINYA